MVGCWFVCVSHLMRITHVTANIPSAYTKLMDDAVAAFNNIRKSNFFIVNFIDFVFYFIVYLLTVDIWRNFDSAQYVNQSLAWIKMCIE